MPTPLQIAVPYLGVSKFKFSKRLTSTMIISYYIKGNLVTVASSFRDSTIESETQQHSKDLLSKTLQTTTATLTTSTAGKRKLYSIIPSKKIGTY